MLRNILTTLLDLAAAALVVAGVAMIYVPAALIVAGAALCAVSWRLATTVESGAPE